MFKHSRSLVFSLCVLVACKTQQDVMNSWLGSTKQEIIMSWGPPARTASDGGTGEILVYSYPGYNPGYNGYGAFSYWDYKYVYTDSNGKIYYWKTEQLRVPPTQIDLNVHRRY